MIKEIPPRPSALEQHGSCDLGEAEAASGRSPIPAGFLLRFADRRRRLLQSMGVVHPVIHVLAGATLLQWTAQMLQWLHLFAFEAPALPRNGGWWRPVRFPPVHMCWPRVGVAPRKPCFDPQHAPQSLSAGPSQCQPQEARVRTASV